jgi:hypothetical protein
MVLVYAPEPGSDVDQGPSFAFSPPGTPIESFRYTWWNATPAKTVYQRSGLWFSQAHEEDPAQLQVASTALEYYIDLPTVSLGMFVVSEGWAGVHVWRLHLYERVSRELLPDLLG